MAGNKSKRKLSNFIIIYRIIKCRLCQIAIDYTEEKQRVLGCFERYTVRMYVNGIVDSYFMWRKAFPAADISEFIRYGIEIVDGACNLLGIN